MNAEKVMDIIHQMDDTERMKLLELLYAEYLDNGRSTRQREKDIQEMDEYGDPHLKEHNEGYE